MIYPNGLVANLITRIRARIQRVTNGDTKSQCFCVKDPATGEIIAVSWFSTETNPPKTLRETEEQFNAAYRSEE